MIFLGNEKPRAPVIDGFGEPTVTGRNHGQSGRHRFQNRVRHTFLVLIGGYFARMQKQMRACVKLEQFPLRQKSNEMHISENPQSIGEHLKLWLERSFASDVKFRFRIVFLKNRKSAQACREAFFRNQPARLYDSPFSIRRRLPVDKWKFIERDPGAIDPQLFRWAAQVDQSVNQRLRACEHEWNRTKKTA